MSENPVHIPDGLPTLSEGGHEPDEGRACVMEYVSVIAGEKFSDMPRCTNPLIAAVARTVNDNIENDVERRLLVPLIDRLAAAGENTPYVNAAIMEAAGLGAYGGPLTGFEIFAASNALRSEVSNRMIRIERTSRIWNHQTRFDAQAGVDFLSRLLDAHEAATRKKATPMSPDALARAKRLIETRDPSLVA